MSQRGVNLQDKGDHVAFINSINLSRGRYSLPENFENRVRAVQPPDNKMEGYVVSGSLATFTENVSGQAKQDILNATLFAQLACDKKHNREIQPVQWYRYYNQILGHLGFVIQNFYFNRYETSGMSFEMDKAVLEIIAAIASGGETVVLMAVLDAMRTLASDDEKIVVFDTHGTNRNLGNFQVCCCEQSPNGDVSLTLGAFHFTASERSNNFLFFSWNSTATNFFKGSQKAVLDSRVYARVRSTIAAKLGINAINLVACIDIWITLVISSWCECWTKIMFENRIENVLDILELPKKYWENIIVYSSYHKYNISLRTWHYLHYLIYVYIYILFNKATHWTQ